MNIALIVVPYDSGHRGLRMGAGPEHLLQAGFPQVLEQNGHSIGATGTVELPHPFRPEIASAFRLNQQISERVQNVLQGRAFPIVLSGNCNSTLGLLAGLRKQRVGLLWYDGHGDYNTPETSISGFFDGMALAIASGACWKSAASTISGFTPLPESNILLIGARDFDPAEKDLIDRSQITWISCDRIDTYLDSALNKLKAYADSVIIHVDLDVLDPQEAPANHYSPPHGLSVEQMIRSVQTIKKFFQVDGLCIASYDPIFDPENRAVEAAKKLALACVRS